jgi:hypothetical protein
MQYYYNADYVSSLALPSNLQLDDRLDAPVRPGSLSKALTLHRSRTEQILKFRDKTP